MWKKKIIGVLLLVAGIFLIANSQANITGNVIGAESFSINVSIGIIFLVSGLAILVSGTIEEKLMPEAKLDTFEVRIRGGKVVCVQGMNDLSNRTLAITQEPLTKEEEERYINLKDLKNLIDEGLVEDEQKERYTSVLREKVKEGYKSAFERISKHIRLDENQKKKLRIAISVEKLIDTINPAYETRKEKLAELKKNPISAEPHVYKPIVAGKAAYVHYSSDDEIDKIAKGKVFDGQALYFSKLEDAEEFVKNTDRKKAKRLTGARFTEKAVVFQTYDPPEKMNPLSGEKTPSMRKAFFKDLEKGEIYTFKEYNVPR
jgi:hypothetical protein